MKFFIDSADVQEIRAAWELGCVEGVATNGRALEALGDLCAIVDGPVSAVCLSSTAPQLIAEGQHLSTLHPNVVVAIPMGLEGLKAVKALSSEGIRTHVTRCFSANQALLCMRAGATWVSPSVSLDERSPDATGLLRDLVTLFRNFGAKTQVVASARNPEQVLQAALLGADVAMLPFSVLLQIAQHEQSQADLERER